MATIDFTLAAKFSMKDKAARIKEELAKELYKFAEDVMAISKERVPVDTGALMNSGHVQLPEIEGAKVSVVMGYGGPSVDYALVVHEDMTRRYRRPGSGPKYLENPLKETQDQLPPRLAAAVARGLGK